MIMVDCCAGLYDSDVTDADKEIKVHFSVTVKDDVAAIGQDGDIGMTVTLGTTQIWAAICNTTIVDKQNLTSNLVHFMKLTLLSDDTQ